MSEASHSTIYRKDYTPFDYLIDSTDLVFELGEETTIVTARMALRAARTGSLPLVLDGRRFRLLEISIDGKQLEPERYSATTEQLTIYDVPPAFNLEIRSELRAQDNTFLEGLYRSGGMFCTQCEAEGFRSITYYPDRPDVLTVFTTTIIAEKTRYPRLLSNGNLVEQGQLADGRHFATWHDPFKKPSYLFALVAGDLVSIDDNFTTCSGRKVDLRIYVHRHNRDKCGHAMTSLKKAMRWDEVTYGREYDLECYMVVAVDDFNMGAMENKGLNIFNSRYVLASPATATDDDYNAIEAVIAHEYFHNWSGNRVTCRDWFQLSLKEGFTVFRDQEFSSDMQSRGVKRISDVRNLRTAQFAEDAGPMAHPVRPDSYIEINNFYTMTVYEKGAEIVRMLHTLLGPEKFRQGSDLYFSRHDGQAVEVDDFVRAMADAGGIDLEQFRLWYSQAGTPEVSALGSYDPSEGTFTLTLRQSCQPTPGQPDKQPLHFPFSMGLLSADGKQLPLMLDGESGEGALTKVLQLRSSEESYRFTGLPAEPVPALLRGFSAPIRLDYPHRHQELLTLMAHEPDPFCRWEAGQLLAARIILDLVAAQRQGRELSLDPAFAEAYGITLSGGQGDHAFLAETLMLPSERYIAELMPVIDPGAIHAARQFVIRGLAALFKDRLLALRESCASPLPYSPGDGLAGRRRLANLCLSYLLSNKEQEIIELCLQQYRTADNMTGQIGALSPLASCDCPERHALLADFYRRWQDDRQVIDKWFSIQATSTLSGTLDEVRSLVSHPAFELTNPNRFRSLVGSFSQGNQARFHAPDGSGYRFLTAQLLRLIPVNPQVSARLLAPLTGWRRFEEGRRSLMHEQLLRINNTPELPRDVYEVVTKSLGGDLK
ncbi:MAG: aminopeptidase N [Geobacteraceae bacterium GWC2_55_20]|nr:MAG: aminopeptidase N [Geobacteraceae bacterium GWC2_55_20]HCE69044.1 aminopeptidase N [Geobacter sp.]